MDSDYARYLTERLEGREANISAVIDAMTPREQRLVREAAVMGYVQGTMAVRTGGLVIPPDSVVMREVVGECLAFPDLYPVTSSLLVSAEPPVTQ